MSDELAPILGWHFTKGEALRDGRDVVVGEVLRHEGELVMCRAGYHMSVYALDALRYAPGPWVWRVEGRGERLTHADKIVCRERVALWGYDATDVLRAFARRCALSVIHLWDAPEVVKRYLATGDETLLAAARAASWDAARAASWDASRAAAAAAAWAVYAAYAADAAADAAAAAARVSAWECMNADLEAAVFAAHESAGD